MNHPHIDPPPIPIIKENHDGKSDKYSVKIKLRKYPTLSTLDLYEFKMSLFDNGEPEKFYCLFATLIRPSRRQGQWRRAKNINTFVL